MFKRSWQVWLCYAAALAVVLPAFGWLTLRVLRLDDDQRIARRAADHDEQVRLALWRMDSLLMPLITQEAARPYQSYEPFVIDDGERIPSPILTQPSPFVLLNFQLASDGTLRSPQAPNPEFHEWANGNGTTPASLVINDVRRNDLSQSVDFNELWDHLPEETLPELALAAANDAMPRNTIGFNTVDNSLLTEMQQTSLDPGPEQRSPPEELALSQSSQQGDLSRRNFALQNLGQQQLIAQRGVPKSVRIPETVTEGVSRPLWLDGRLMLARRVTIAGRPVIQGCWLNWESLRESLLLEIADLVPGASLVPIADDETADPGRMLASIPVALKADMPPAGAAGLTPIRGAVLTAWVGLLFGCVAIGLLLHGVQSLSERRAAFVSAVTHELRTPLTTFQLYTDLLADDLLKDETKRRDYLQTLRGESQRLEHLIENVLTYSQLERRPERAPGHVLKPAELLDRVGPGLEDLARRSERELVIERDESIASAMVRADPSLVEQVLFNLVDNACKHASAAEHRRIVIRASRDASNVVLTVRDFGPGIPADVRARLFRPFSKSVERAAESAPGVGLGLALSRGLARQMGGDLTVVEDGTSGATFRLTLPLATN
jgi:signal transduction histidine kinase